MNLGHGKKWLAAVACGFFVLTAAPSFARSIPFSSAYFDEELKDEKVPAFLERFLANQGFAVIISESVRGIEATLNGPRQGSSSNVFESVIRAYQLVYYYDGTAVHLYRSGERVTRDYSLPPSTVERFVRAAADLRLIGVGDRYNTFQASPATGMVSIIGTPRFADRIEAVLKNVQTQTPIEPVMLRYFPLKYAVAADTYMVVGNREIVVPGVATILAQVMNARTPTVTRENRRGGRNSGVARNRLTDASLPGQDPNQSAALQNEDYFLGPNYQSAAPAPNYGRPDDAQVVADQARNAVIVRDTKERMPMYADVLRSLDVPSMVIEIEATIIDINTEKAKRVGFNWRWDNAGNELQFGGRNDFKPSAIRATNGLPVVGNQAPDRNNIDNLPQLPGFGAGAILGRGDNYKFVARINALADDGVTRVVSRPQIATLNDVEAAIEATETVYVPVNGTYAVDLFDVAAGTLLRVTPHVINEGNKRQIRLAVNIEDGSVSSVPSGADQVANFSTTSRNQINTQVIIEEGQSVLLGGLIRERASRGDAQIPVLGKIPLLGALFRDRADSKSRTERLFLLTPRIRTANTITTQTADSVPAFEVDSVFEPEVEMSESDPKTEKKDAE